MMLIRDAPDVSVCVGACALCARSPSLNERRENLLRLMIEFRGIWVQKSIYEEILFYTFAGNYFFTTATPPQPVPGKLWSIVVCPCTHSPAHRAPWFPLRAQKVHKSCRRAQQIEVLTFNSLANFSSSRGYLGAIALKWASIESCLQIWAVDGLPERERQTQKQRK